MPTEYRDIRLKISIQSDHMNRALNEIDKAIQRIHHISNSAIDFKEVIMKDEIYDRLKDCGIINEHRIILMSEETLKGIVDNMILEETEPQHAHKSSKEILAEI